MFRVVERLEYIRTHAFIALIQVSGWRAAYILARSVWPWATAWCRQLCDVKPACHAARNMPVGTSS